MYSGGKKTPAVTVTDAEGKVLTKGTDYSVTYENNINVGTASAIITGKGVYSGTKTVHYSITQQSLIHDKVVMTAEDTQYAVDGAKTTVVVTDRNGIVLTEGKDYTLTYTDNTKIGTAKVMATGCGNYKSSVSTTFSITPKDISSLTVHVKDVNAVYTGKAFTPAVTVDGLTENTDFTVTGIGNYTGTKKCSFSIAPASLENAIITDGSVYVYTGSEIKADINVVDVNGNQLTEDVDYYIESCVDNIEVGIAKMTIVGMGNYTGKAEHQYEIHGVDSEGFTVEITPDTFVYDGEEHIPTINVVSDSGKVLTEGTDYSVSIINNRDAGTATVKITGIGNYIRIIERTFTITPVDLADCTVSLSYTTTKYDGKEKKPEVIVTTTNGKTLVQDTDYTVVYSSNTEAGTAAVTVTGIGNYTGTVVKNFAIRSYKVVNVVSGVHLYWNEVDGVTKYGIWRSETGKNGTYKWVANPTTTHYLDKNVESGKTYYYKISNVNVCTKMRPSLCWMSRQRRLTRFPSEICICGITI